LSPILVRPVREQLEHDRIIRLLQSKLRRRYEAGMNPGTEQNVAVGTGVSASYPDLVLQSPERSRRLQGLVEVETGESVNHLEALAQWAYFSKVRAPFHLYVPAGMVDVARRLCEDNHIHVSEIWSYHTVGDQVRFTMVHRTRESPPQPQKRESKPTPRVPERKAEKAEKKPEKKADQKTAKATPRPRGQRQPAKKKKR